MKIYTKRGDSGETDLIGAGRVPKDHIRVEAYGAVDELNAALGVALAVSEHDDLGTLGRTIQATLFDLGAYLATPDAERRSKSAIGGLGAKQVASLEAEIDRLERELPPLRSFILPGGAQAAAAFHLARTVCRRAERRLVALAREDALEPEALAYVNRLSDLLFTFARVENRRAGSDDIEWHGSRR